MGSQEDVYEQRRRLLIRWVDQFQSQAPGNTKKAFAAKVGISDSYLHRLLSEPTKEQHKNIDTVLANRIELALGREGQLLNPAAGESRSHAYKAAASAAPFIGSAPRLPEVPEDKLSLIALPNTAPEIQALAQREVLGLQVPTDDAIDKVVVLPHDIGGTNAKTGQIAVFRPVPAGRRLKPTNMPVLVKRSTGVHVITSFDSAYDGSPPPEVVAVCYLFHSPQRTDLFE
jgi:hypothetical protein